MLDLNHARKSECPAFACQFSTP